MNLRDIFKKMSKKELEKFYERFNADSIEELVNKVTLLYRVQFSCLKEEELKTIYKLKSNEKIDNVSSFLLDYMYVYNDNGKYILPSEVRNIVDIYNFQYINNNRIYNYLTLYLNLVLFIPLKDLKEVCKKNGFNVTIKFLKDFFESEHYIIENDVVYKDIVVVTEADNMEIPKEYKAIDIHYACLLNVLYYDCYCHKLDNILGKYIKETFGSSYIYCSTVIMDVIMPKDKKKVMNNLKKEFQRCHMGLGDLSKAMNIIEEIHSIFPIAECGGYSLPEVEDGMSDEEYNDFIFNEFINGDIRVD